MNKRDTGKFWENYAASYLRRQGYFIICRNWTGRWAELDLIVEKDHITVFVEVKYRSSDRYGTPEESITYKKRLSLRQAIIQYIGQKGCKKIRWRFDVVCIYKNGKISLRHYCGIPL